MDETIDNFIKSRKGEEEVLNIVNDIRATKVITQNSNVMKALILQKLIQPRKNRAGINIQKYKLIVKIYVALKNLDIVGIQGMHLIILWISQKGLNEVVNKVKNKNKFDLNKFMKKNKKGKHHGKLNKNKIEDFQSPQLNFEKW